MEGYESNSACVLDYLALFQALWAGERDDGACRERWARVQRRERATEGAPLAPPRLRRRFGLGERDFLLVMAALALEMDGGGRGAFRRTYGLSLPTVEYGLQLISPLCPSTCETLSELAGAGPLGGLLLLGGVGEGYPLERPLVLCRAALAFLTGFGLAEIPGCTPLTESRERWLPIHQDALGRVRAWYEQGTGHTLYLCAPPGSGRRTLLRRACGNVVCTDLAALAELSAAEREQATRETAALAILLDAPVCALPGPEGQGFGALERLCRRYAIPLAALAEGEGATRGAGEVIRLPGQLSPGGRREAWQVFLPQAAPSSAPAGAMNIGAVRETASLARRFAAAAGREAVQEEDTRQAVLQRSGGLGLEVCPTADATLEDMVLPEGVRAQLERICQAARWEDRLAEWGIPGFRGGVTAVFHGPSGTGKTMAASAIAHRLGMPLLRADLARIMDKYVGETEKHLGRLLRGARENRCVLLFDEADALFGKRAAVSGGQDKYANLSTSYLLQEIEGYDGVALLSTNLLRNFDDAFLRRLQYIVRFSLPDAALREQLWRRALPPERCQGELPYALLAQAELSPARVFSAARGAAVAALGAGRDAVDVAGAVEALRLELEKSDKALPAPLAALGQGEKGG